MKIEEIRKMLAKKQIEAFLNGMKQLGFTEKEASALLEQHTSVSHREE